MDEIKEIEARIRNVLIHFETAPAAEASAPIPASALPRPASPAQDTDPMARSLGQEPSLDGVEPHGQEPPAQEAPLDGVGSHGQEPPLDAVESHGQEPPAQEAPLDAVETHGQEPAGIDTGEPEPSSPWSPDSVAQHGQEERFYLSDNEVEPADANELEPTDAIQRSFGNSTASSSDWVQPEPDAGQ